MVLALIGYRRQGIDAASVSPGLAVGPALAAALFVALAWRVLRSPDRADGGTRARRFRRLSVGWLMVYDLAWLISLGFWWQSLTIVFLIGLVALGLGRPGTAAQNRVLSPK